jgi:hypothetical protein
VTETEVIQKKLASFGLEENVEYSIGKSKSTSEESQVRL